MLPKNNGIIAARQKSYHVTMLDFSEPKAQMTRRRSEQARFSAELLANKTQTAINVSTLALHAAHNHTIPSSGRATRLVALEPCPNACPLVECGPKAPRPLLLALLKVL
jgi:hypothetical protein